MTSKPDETALETTGPPRSKDRITGKAPVSERQLNANLRPLGFSQKQWQIEAKYSVVSILRQLWKVRIGNMS